MIFSQRQVPKADKRIHYGPDESQFGDLWMPVPGPAPGHLSPVIAFLHGGWWSSGFDLNYGNPLCDVLRHLGITVWSLEYRRTGISGGGWPMTFQDAASGFDYLRVIARSVPIDLHRVIVIGHSAGGHLAFWLAGRHHVPEGSVIGMAPQVAIRGVLSLAGVVDLGLLLELAVGRFAPAKAWVLHFMGGSVLEYADRYAAGDPGQLLPLPCRQSLIQGAADLQVPPTLAQRWVAKSRREGAACDLHMVPRADHFDLIHPQSAAWPAVRRAVVDLL